MTCPICSKPTHRDYAPFCSRRCADVDLSRWLKGGYAIPGGGAGEGDEASAPGPESHENNGLEPPTKGMDRE